jgi:hypothetical protein
MLIVDQNLKNLGTSLFKEIIMTISSLHRKREVGEPFPLVFSFSYTPFEE